MVSGPFEPLLFDGKQDAIKGNKILVLKFDSAWLKKRNALAIKYGAKSDYADYKAHVTIAYTSFKGELADLTTFNGPLEIVSESHAPVNTNWTDKVTK